MKGSKLFAAEFGKRYPTSWVRRRVVMPLSALALVAGVIAAPLGWIFAAVAWSGDDVQQVRATMVEVEEFVERRKGCDQEATLRLGLVVKATCLDGMVPPNSIRAGQEVDVGIQKAKLGILIVSIGATDRQASNLR